MAAKGETAEAIESMKEALRIEPETKVIRSLLVMAVNDMAWLLTYWGVFFQLFHMELKKLMKRNEKQTKSQKEMYKRMFASSNENANNQVIIINYLFFIFWEILIDDWLIMLFLFFSQSRAGGRSSVSEEQSLQWR